MVFFFQSPWWLAGLSIKDFSGLVVVVIVHSIFFFTLLIPRFLKYLLHSCQSVLRPLRAVKKHALLLLFKKADVI